MNELYMFSIFIDLILNALNSQTLVEHEAFKDESKAEITEAVKDAF